MKAYIIATLLAVTSISSVSSAMCMKRFLSSVGMNSTSNTNFYSEANRSASGSTPGKTTASASGESSKRQH